MAGMSSRRLPLWISCLLFLASCVNIPVDYSEFENFGSEGIPDDMTFDFNPYPRDSISAIHNHYDVVLTVRYSNRCPSRNLILDVEEISLSSQDPATTRYDIPLFSDSGTPLGKGSLGLYEISDTLHRNVRISEEYIMAFSCPLPPVQTRGIDAIGVSLVRTGEPTTFSVKKLSF